MCIVIVIILIPIIIYVLICHIIDSYSQRVTYDNLPLFMQEFIINIRFLHTDIYSYIINYKYQNSSIPHIIYLIRDRCLNIESFNLGFRVPDISNIDINNLFFLYLPTGQSKILEQVLDILVILPIYTNCFYYDDANNKIKLISNQWNFISKNICKITVTSIISDTYLVILQI